jgi:hypothetical protein
MLLLLFFGGVRSEESSAVKKRVEMRSKVKREDCAASSFSHADPAVVQKGLPFGLSAYKKKRMQGSCWLTAVLLMARRRSSVD